MLKPSLFIFTGVIFFTVNAFAFNNQNINAYIPNGKLVGTGQASIMFWDLYEASLFAPEGVFSQDKPFAISLKYLMDIEGRKIADHSTKEMRRLGVSDEVKLATWHSQMDNLFPNVKEGNQITGIYTSDKRSIFYKDDHKIGEIKDPEFGHNFFRIWLDQKTERPTLRLKLIGATP